MLLSLDRKGTNDSNLVYGLFGLLVLSGYKTEFAKLGCKKLCFLGKKNKRKKERKKNRKGIIARPIPRAA